MAIRYIARTGTGDGSALGAAAPWSDINAQIIAAGAGGEVRLVDDGAGSPWPDSVRRDISAGGTSGNRVKIRGVAADGSTRKLIIFQSNRTSPWPTTLAGAQAAVEGTQCIRYRAGAGWIQWLDVKWKNTGIAHVVEEGVTVPGLAFGYIELLDVTLVAMIASFRANYPKWARYSVAACNAAKAIKDWAIAYKAGLSSDDLDKLENGFGFENVLRGFTVGASSVSTAGTTGFRMAGGMTLGTARGGIRLNGVWSDAIVMDHFIDGQMQKDKNGSSCFGFDRNGTGSGLITARIESSRNSNGDTSGDYSNGDGFTAENRCTEITDVCPSGYDNTDGLLDSKAFDHIIINPKGSGFRRGLRNWGFQDVYEADLWDPAANKGYTPCMVYASQNEMCRIHTGRFEFTSAYNPTGITTGLACFFSDTDAFLAVSNRPGAVTVVGKPSYVNNFLVASSAVGIFFDPTVETVPTFTSAAARSAPEGATYSWNPAMTVPGRFYKNGGADAALFTLPSTRNKTVSLPTQLLSDPKDADGNSTYLIGLRGYTAQGQTATQNVTVTIAGSTVPAPDIPQRMVNIGSPAPNGTLEAAYDAASAALTASGLHLKLDALEYASHSDLAGRVSWQAGGYAGGVLSPDGTRAFPLFIPGKGYQAASGRWCYANAPEVKFTPKNNFSFVWTQPSPTGAGGVFGKPSNAVRANNGNAVIRAMTTTEFTVVDGFNGDGFVGWSRVENEVKSYVDGVLVNTRTLAGAASVPAGTRRFGSATDVSGTAPMPIRACGWGYSLSDDEVATLYEILATLDEAVRTYFAALPPIMVTAAKLIGIFSEEETIARQPAVWNRVPSSVARYWQIDGSTVSTATAYKLPVGSAGKMLRYGEAATDDGGTSEVQWTEAYLVSTPPPARYLAPVAMGTGAGDTPDNAAAFSTVNSIAAAYANHRLLLRADQGEYGAAVTLSNNDVIFDSYHPTDPNTRAVIHSNRPDPYVAGAANGGVPFTLAGGAGNLVYRRLNWKNIGNGCINAAGTAISGMQIRDMDITNCYRFLELGDPVVHSNFLVENINVVGIERSFIRVAVSHDFTIRNCVADANYVRDEGFPSLYAFRSCYNVLVEDCVGKNVIWSPAPPAMYWNGDNFETDDDCYNITFRRCHAEVASDGGFDLKGSITLEDCSAKSAKHSIRFWFGPHVCRNFVSETPINHGGSGNKTHFGFYGSSTAGAVVDMYDPIVNDDGEDGYYAPIFTIENPHCRIKVTGTAGIEVKPGQTLVANSYPIATHPDNYSEIIFDPPVPGFDRYGKAVSGPVESRNYGPFVIRATDSEGRTATMLWSPVVFKAPN